VGEVDDEIVLLQLEEAVDGPRFEAPPRQDDGGRLAQEQLVIAQDDDAGDVPVSCPPLPPGERG
jgi:hypothetical protein